MSFRYKPLALLPLFVWPFISSNNAFSQDFIDIQTKMLNDSKLTIFGTANVTSFECEYTKDLEQDTLNHQIKPYSDTIIILGDALNLRVNEFNCGKRAINKDFKNALKYKEHPNIKINLLNVYIYKEIPTHVDVAITITNVTKHFTIYLEQHTNEVGNIMVKGFQDLKMTDFSIKPPTALFGLIKVHDDLRIEFDLNLDTKVVNNLN